MADRHLARYAAANLATDTGDHSDADRGDSDYEGGAERVRTSIMAAFGYFHTESSHHASEYLPWFRKDAGSRRRVHPEALGLLSRSAPPAIAEARPTELLEKLKAELKPSVEYGAMIVNAMETGEPAVIYGNVPNRGLIDNLPDGCCVEVACLVDRNGVQPTALRRPAAATGGRQPDQHQRAGAGGAGRADRRREHVYHAIMLDPLTGALLTLDQIRAMTDELLAAEREWLPRFARRGGQSQASLAHKESSSVMRLSK